MPIRSTTNKDGQSLLHIDGDMTIYTAAEIKDELMTYMAQPCEREIDLSEVSEMDSAGLQMLILAKREAERHGTSLRLTGHSRAVLDVLDLCNLALYFGDPVILSCNEKKGQ
ncbi:Anti-sigma factor antagonist [Candidatus Nitrotoga sp. HW29]|uniref:STAS domain-containing protein n=1 Tax=Candidatus Nitrotoga sp. HW29 TaxID=2886963 RepID=UPI001EF318D0|nr:STAS domain-containing protein [Candidatus Nitrotoga sp. HW29]CAH1904228.1 Anti-sigma factor antagonist [Candidatus Nitrotoga sp. HW29]